MAEGIGFGGAADDDADGVVGLEEELQDAGADEAGCAGYENGFFGHCWLVD